MEPATLLKLTANDENKNETTQKPIESKTKTKMKLKTNEQTCNECSKRNWLTALELIREGNSATVADRMKKMMVVSQLTKKATQTNIRFSDHLEKRSDDE